MTGCAHGLKKNERICSRRLMDELFSGDGSKGVSVYPIRAVYMTKEQQQDMPPVMMMVSVSKRHFKRAVKRNRVKRQLREAYRLNKEILWNKATEKGCNIVVAFIWIADEIVSSAEVSSKMATLMRKIAERL